MVLKPILKLIQITTASMIQVKQLSGHRSLIPEDIQVKSIETELQCRHLVKRGQLISMSMFRTKPILMVKDKLLKIIALDT